jgi:hypothetical protein
MGWLSIVHGQLSIVDLSSVTEQRAEEVVAVQELFLKVLGEVVVVIGGFEADAGVLDLKREERTGGSGFGLE